MGIGSFFGANRAKKNHLHRGNLKLNMGRQTAVALSEDDERDFLLFLRAGADIKIYQWSAPSPDLIPVPEFPRRGPGQHSYRLWNTTFAWEPEFAQWEAAKVRDPNIAGSYYLKNTAGAPLIEYTREPFENPNALVHGRVYWNTDFAVYAGPAYDTALFARWFDKVVRWLRTRGTRVELTKGWYQYWLPGAWGLRNADSRGPGLLGGKP